MEDREWVPAVLASDYDGDLHLVALTDDVEDWEVVVTRENGSTEVVEPEPARSFHYYPALHGRPSWFVDHDLGNAGWELRVGGRLITDLRGDRQGNVPTETAAADQHAWAAEKVRELAREWRDHPDRPQVRDGVLEHWDGLVDWWVGSREAPLPIRGAAGKRGLVRRPRGFPIVYTDNSPAQWVFARAAWDEWTPEPSELTEAIHAEMPVAMILSRKEKEQADLTTVLGNAPSTQARGYRLCHVDRVAAGGKSVANLKAQELRDRGRRLIDPRNMFVVPIELRGFGEVDQFIDVMRARAR